jgi:molybdate transport system substrate-binding protein
MSACGIIGCGVGFLLAVVTAASAQGGRGQKAADAKPGEVRLMATAAIRTPLEAVRAEAAKAVGHPLVIQYGSARGNLKDEILAGMGFDVAMLLPDVNDELLKAGKIARSSVDIARVNIAIGLRGDVASIDLSTPATVKQSMLNATSLRWSPTGAALLTVNKMLDTLGIREAVKAKHNMPAPVPLGPGDYEINIYPQSEILENKALRNLGPVIPALQVPAVITAVISAQTMDVKAATAVIRFLQGPTMDPALEASGMSR